MNKFAGTVTFKGNPETISDKLTKQTIVVAEETDKFPATIAIDFVNDKIELLNNINTGDLVEVQLNFRANESKTQPGKFFNSISWWKIIKDQSQDIL